MVSEEFPLEFFMLVFGEGSLWNDATFCMLICDCMEGTELKAREVGCKCFWYACDECDGLF